MNFLVKVLAILFVASLVLSARADDQPNIPASAWEQHPEGIALAFTLSSRAEGNRQVISIYVYIKNTSNADWYFERNKEPAIYYIRDHDVPLRNYDESMFEESKKVTPERIKPGGTGSRTIDLTPAELALIKGLPVKCRVIIYDERYKRYEIESSSKILVSK